MTHAQELKGNIRVFARVRPAAAGEAAEAAPGAPVLGFPAAGELAGRGLELRQPAAGGKGGDVQAHSFAFDKVFTPQASQVSWLTCCALVAGPGSARVFGVPPCVACQRGHCSAVCCGRGSLCTRRRLVERTPAQNCT